MVNESTDSLLYTSISPNPGSGVLLAATTCPQNDSHYASIPLFDTPTVGRKTIYESLW